MPRNAHSFLRILPFPRPLPLLVWELRMDRPRENFCAVIGECRHTCIIPHAAAARNDNRPHFGKIALWLYQRTPPSTKRAPLPLHLDTGDSLSQNPPALRTDRNAAARADTPAAFAVSARFAVRRRPAGDEVACEITSHHRHTRVLSSFAASATRRDLCRDPPRPLP